MIAAAAVTLLASTSLVAPALAGQPILSGTYMVHQRLLCQASETINHNGKKLQFTATSPGDVTLAIGTLTFTPSADGAADGKVKGTTANAEGSLLVSTVDGVTTGTPMNLSKVNKVAGTYSIAGNILQLKIKKLPTLNFDSVFGQVDGNTAISGTLDGVAVNGSPSDCSAILRLDRQ